MPVAQSKSLNIYRNLALETFWMEEALGEPLLFLWQSHAVVLGKNQNPWKECRLEAIQVDGISLARRISGGGTVYHDKGNLNYSLILPRSAYDPDKAFEMVLDALASCGIPAEKTGKSNLSTRGLKFSGNAFSFRKGQALHHGTLLLNADLDRLQRYLGPTIESLKTRAVPSVPAPVINLGVEIFTLCQAMQESFARYYGRHATTPLSLPAEDHPRLMELEQLYRSDEWIFGATPPFEVEQNGLHLRVEKGIIVRAEGGGADSLVGQNFQPFVRL